MIFNFSVIGSLIVVLLGLISSILIYNSYGKLTTGKLRDLMLWLFLTVTLCGLPYAIWNFLLESHTILIEDLFLRALPGAILVTLFFLFILRCAFIARDIGRTYGFRDKFASLAKTIVGSAVKAAAKTPMPKKKPKRKVTKKTTKKKATKKRKK